MKLYYTYDEALSNRELRDIKEKEVIGSNITLLRQYLEILKLTTDVDINTIKIGRTKANGEEYANIILYVKSDKHDYIFTIFKMTDDWWYVELYISRNYDKLIKNNIDQNQDFFCDGLKGLVSLIKKTKDDEILEEL